MKKSTDGTPRGTRPLLYPLSLLLLGLVAFFSNYAQRPPAPAPENAPPADFSAARALAHVEAVAARPRPVGSAEHAAARDYVFGALSSRPPNSRASPTSRTLIGLKCDVSGP
jgi:hypothetical protein